MKFEDYYDNFYGYKESTQLSKISTLTDINNMNLVCDIVGALGEKGGSLLLRKVIDSNILIDTKYIVELSYNIDVNMLRELIEIAIKNKLKFTADEINTLIDLDDKNINQLLVFNNLDVLIEENGRDNLEYLQYYLDKKDYNKLMKQLGYNAQENKVSIITKVAGILVIFSILDKIFSNKKD